MMYKLIFKSIIKVLCCVLFVFASVETIAQGDDKPSTYFPNFMPPPNSASLGIYGKFPSQFAGNANISLLLLEIKSNS